MQPKQRKLTTQLQNTSKPLFTGEQRRLILPSIEPHLEEVEIPSPNSTGHSCTPVISSSDSIWGFYLGNRQSHRNRMAQQPQQPNPGGNNDDNNISIPSAQSQRMSATGSTMARQINLSAIQPPMILSNPHQIHSQLQQIQSPLQIPARPQPRLQIPGQQHHPHAQIGSPAQIGQAQMGNIPLLPYANAQQAQQSIPSNMIPQHYYNVPSMPLPMVIPNQQILEITTEQKVERGIEDFLQQPEAPRPQIEIEGATLNKLQDTLYEILCNRGKSKQSWIDQNKVQHVIKTIEYLKRRLYEACTDEELQSIIEEKVDNVDPEINDDPMAGGGILYDINDSYIYIYLT